MLQLEALETRQMLTTLLNGNVLEIWGTDSPDSLQLSIYTRVSRVGSTKSFIRVNFNGFTTVYDAAGIGHIEVNTLGGNDNVSGIRQASIPMIIHGGAGNDLLAGGGGNDFISGEGDDVLVGRLGNDVFSGGPGIDRVDYSACTANLMLSIDGGANDRGDENDNILLDVEQVWGGSGNDFISGSSDANTLCGMAGNDTLLGLAGNDNLQGGLASAPLISLPAGSDSIDGGLGNDKLNGGFGNDRILGSGGQDAIFGQAGNDVLLGEYGDDDLDGGDGNDVIDAGAGNDRIWDRAGSDLALGGDGDDRITGGAGDDVFYGGAGQDTIITLGGGQADHVYGGEGVDSFWTDGEAAEIIGDASAFETAAGYVHRVSSFSSIQYWAAGGVAMHMTPSREIDGVKLPDPAPMLDHQPNFKYVDCSASPLFSASGPVADDVNQGMTGDCFFLAPASALAKQNPNVIRQSIIDLGDGTYAVRLYTLGKARYFRIDGDMPTDTNGGLLYACPGASGAIWAMLLEKAFAFARKGQGHYDSVYDGSAVEGYAAFNLDSAVSATGLYILAGADRMAKDMQENLKFGAAMTIRTPKDGVPAALVSKHVYMVDRVYTTAAGQYRIVLRNPWGVDGNSSLDGTDDGYVDLSAKQVYSIFSSIFWA